MYAIRSYYVALGDVALGLLHRLLERRLAEHRHGRFGTRRRFGRNGHRLTQFGEQFLEPGARFLIGAGETGFGIDNQRQLAGQVVDDGA